MDLKSRGAGFDPKNRFEKLYVDYSDENLDSFDDDEQKEKPQTVFYVDNSKTIIAHNESPDVGFDYSINPYRGCEHGCVYCYARPTHEYLGFSSGLDFETKIMVKQDAPELLAKEFSKKSWIPQPVALSGDTDCYQPVERKLLLTRKCLEVFLKFRNPVSIITKNAMILRDLDILKELASENLVRATISISSLNRELTRKMEPRTSVPSQRLHTIEELSKNGIKAGVLVAPIIPGLTDEEIPQILKRASEHGAKFAGKVMLRLPHQNEDLFIEWLSRNYPEKSSKILNRIKEIRQGKLNDPNFNSRMTGTGEIADVISNLYRASIKKYNLNKHKEKLATDKFIRKIDSLQTELF